MIRRDLTPAQRAGALLTSIEIKCGREFWRRSDRIAGMSAGTVQGSAAQNNRVSSDPRNAGLPKAVLRPGLLRTQLQLE
jgi:hypothetical protein